MTSLEICEEIRLTADNIRDIADEMMDQVRCKDSLIYRNIEELRGIACRLKALSGIALLK